MTLPSKDCLGWRSRSASFGGLPESTLWVECKIGDYDIVTPCPPLPVKALVYTGHKDLLVTSALLPKLCFLRVVTRTHAMAATSGIAYGCALLKTLTGRWAIVRLKCAEPRT